MTVSIERRLLQILVGLAGFVPLIAGFLGAISGATFFHLMGPAAAQSHGAYLSGLLFGIGLGFWSCVPGIENKSARFSVLAAIVFIGGLARAFTAVRLGAVSPVVIFALTMELLVTPALFLWQRRIAAPISR